MIEDLGRIFQPLKEQFLSFPAKDNQAKIADNLPGSATVNYTNMTTLV